jgi:hypothetical protein
MTKLLLAVLTLALCTLAAAQVGPPVIKTFHGDDGVVEIPTTTIIFADTSASGSPVQFAGALAMTFSQPDPNTDRLSETPSVTMTNVSAKTLLGVVALVKATDINGGPGFTITHTQEFYFRDIGFPAGEAMVVADRSNKEIKVQGHFPPIGAPHAEVELVFAQFADGTVWGDQSTATGFLQDRAAVGTLLQQLSTAYASGGAAGFTVELAKDRPSRTPVRNVQEQLRDMMTNSGVDMVAASVNDRLSIANGRLAEGVH